MKAKRIRICGRKTITAPTPAISPSATKERKIPGGKADRAASWIALTPASMPSAKGVAQAKTA